MTNPAAHQQHRSLPMSRRHVIGVLALLTALAVSGCTPHTVSVTDPCRTVSGQGSIVVISDRGAVGLARIGLTPRGLKAEQNC
jgi:hypothetical protein